MFRAGEIVKKSNKVTQTTCTVYDTGFGEEKQPFVLSNTGFRVKRGVCDEEVKAAKEGLYTPSQHALVDSAADKKDISCSLLSFLPFCS
jgi:hypothetical protein